MAAASAARLILASASPRRRALLEQIGLPPNLIVGAEIDEAAKLGESPPQTALRLARAKAAAVARTHGDDFVLAADTVVARGRRALPKPTDVAQARQCLRALSGRRHRVHTAIALNAPRDTQAARLVTTVVEFKRLADAEIEGYLASGEWRGKAGGYAIQGRAAALVKRISGSYSNVVGLPLHETVNLLGGLGFPVQRRWSGSDADGDSAGDSASGELE